MTFALELKANETLKKILLDRGYTLEEESKENFSLRGYKDKNHIITFICTDDKLSIQGIKEFISIMNKEKCLKCIIIYRDSVTSSAKKSLEIMEYNIELFSINELQFNITEHRLVPLHERVSKEEKENLEQNYKGKLPIILSSDPISRYYYFQRGEYIRITRKDGTIHYRVVK